MENIIVLFGKPGAGKGTRLSKFLEGKEDQFEVLSVGKLLRKAVNEQTELGQRAKSYMDSGKLVPDDIVNAIAIEGLKNAKKPIFTDGFPRTVAQAKAMLDSGVRPTTVVELYVDDEVVIERSRIRIVCKSCNEPYTTTDFKSPKVKGVCDKCGSELVKRIDDDERVVRNRLEVYRNETHPVLKVMKEANIPIVTIDNTDLKTSSTNFENLILSL